jgi:glyoxylase-like metal-dependent hydrolase (beta-lactamase superfamily II)
MFSDLSTEGGEAVQANQFLIVNDDTGAIIDPGGNLAYSELYLGMTKYFAPSRLSAIIASHADPDIIASLDRWMTATPDAKLYVSTLWERFVPHFCKPGKTLGRVVGIPDPGMHISIGDCELIAVPAHFMHAEGNFQFYDPISKILFSGDLGVNFLGKHKASDYITSLSPAARWHGGLPPSLHGVGQDPALLGPHGAPDGHPHDRAAARCAAGRPRRQGVHRLGRRPVVRHRPDDRRQLHGASSLRGHAAAWPRAIRVRQDRACQLKT